MKIQFAASVSLLELNNFLSGKKMAKYLRIQYRHWTLWCDRCCQCITTLLEDHFFPFYSQGRPLGEGGEMKFGFYSSIQHSEWKAMLVNIDGELLQFVKSHIIFMFLPLLWKNLRNIWNVVYSVMFKYQKIHFQEFTVILEMSYCFLLKLSFPVFLILNPLIAFSSYHQYAYSPYCSLYISWDADKKNLIKNQEPFVVGDHFLYFCDLHVCLFVI